jgi:hypothetical protein
MLSGTEGFSDKLDVGVDLEREMSELMALRRAVCLLIASRSRPKHFGRAAANNLQQSWRFDWEPPKAVLRDVRTIDWILGG